MQNELVGSINHLINGRGYCIIAQQAEGITFFPADLRLCWRFIHNFLKEKANCALISELAGIYIESAMHYLSIN